MICDMFIYINIEDITKMEKSKLKETIKKKTGEIMKKEVAKKKEVMKKLRFVKAEDT